MEWLIFIIFGLISVGGINYRKIEKYICTRKNLKGVKSALYGSEASKIFYVTYFGLIKSDSIPHIQIKIEDGVILPENLYDQETICVNISPVSIRDLKFEMEKLSFSTCFNNTPFIVEVPMRSIQLTYSEELGVAFDVQGVNRGLNRVNRGHPYG